MPRGRRSHALLMVFVLLASVPAGVGGGARPTRAADSCATETEPNDTPEQSQTFSGAVCVNGTLPDGDQDIFVWDLSAADAAKRWTVALRASRTRSPDSSCCRSPLTRALPRSPPARPSWSRRSTILDRSRHPGEPADPAGRYVLGVSRSGTTADAAGTLDYQASIAEGDAMPPNGDREPNEDAGHANPVQGGFSLCGDLDKSVDRYAWTLSKDDAARAWSLEADGTLGASLFLALEKPDGTQLTSQGADSQGRAHCRTSSCRGPVHHRGPARLGRRASLRPERQLEQSVEGDAEPNDTPATAIPLDPRTSWRRVASAAQRHATCSR